MTDRYAVVGNPIEHSKSPQIHEQFARQTGEDLLYTKQKIELGEFESQVHRFFEHGGKGLNVTVPFKEEAFELAKVLTLRAQTAGAVNTLAIQPDGTLLGDNTDGAGLVLDLKNHQVTLAGKRILILGAGGAVKGVLKPLLDEQPAELVIANRTLAKAEALAEQFGDSTTAYGFDDLHGQFDLIINGTSASLAGELPPIPPSVVRKRSGPAAATIGYDMMYGAGVTVFNHWMLHQGAEQVIDGLGMLVGQAAEAFYVWRGIKPKTAEVITMLRQDRRRG